MLTREETKKRVSRVIAALPNPKSVSQPQLDISKLGQQAIAFIDLKEYLNNIEEMPVMGLNGSRRDMNDGYNMLLLLIKKHLKDLP